MPALPKPRTRRRLTKRQVSRPSKLFAKKVMQVVNKEVEVKRIEQNATGAFLTTNAIVHLTPIAQGDDILNRDGNDVRLRRVISNVVVHSTGALDHECRILHFYWNDDTTPTLGDILTNPYRVLHDKVYEDKKAFVFDDRMYTLLANQDKQVVTVRINKALKNMKCRFNGTLATNDVSGQIYCMVLLDAIDSGATYSISSRVFFTDM